MSYSLTSTTNDINTGLGDVAVVSYDYVTSLLINPVIILIIFIVFIYLIIFMFSTKSNTKDSLDAPKTENISGRGVNILGIILIILFVLIVIMNFLQYFFGIDIVARIKNIMTKHPEVDIKIDTSRLEATQAPVKEILLRKQVFNIPGNYYVYNDAKALCKAYGARLANYEEIEQAYKDGGEWCNYGWSDDQYILYPTQYETWKKLQNIEGHENDCGHPGINGGYIANPHLRFGVNCYGYKPRITKEEQELMKKQPIYPITMKDIAFMERVNYWKDRLTEILVSPFNHSTWSRI